MHSDAKRRPCRNCHAVLPLSCFGVIRPGFWRKSCWACFRQYRRAYNARPEVRARRVEYLRQEWVRMQSRERMRRKRAASAARARQGGGR